MTRSATTILLLLTFSIIQSFEAAAASLPPGAVPMTAEELSAMYSGKTQIWPVNKGGWFFARDHRLAGYAVEGSSYAVGRWTIRDAGRVCIRARWIWAKGPRGRGPFKTTCWDHQKFLSEIWKKNSEKEVWYKWNAPGGEGSNFIKGYKYYDQVTELNSRFGR